MHNVPTTKGNQIVTVNGAPHIAHDFRIRYHSVEMRNIGAGGFCCLSPSLCFILFLRGGGQLQVLEPIVTQILRVLRICVNILY